MSARRFVGGGDGRAAGVGGDKEARNRGDRFVP